MDFSLISVIIIIQVYRFSDGNFILMTTVLTTDFFLTSKNTSYNTVKGV